MSNQKLWVFGDSFSVPFELMKHIPYIPYKGYVPKIYSEVVAEEFGYELMDNAVGGASNVTIFHKFISVVDQIADNDVVIFGWTQNFRFRIASETNLFTDILIGVIDQYVINNFSKEALLEIGDNKESQSVYFTEITDYIKLINHTLKNNIVLHWTWVEPNKNPDRNEQKYYDQLLPFKKYLSVTQETDYKLDDFHYGEMGHYDLAQKIISKIELIS
jgi:hypothetical protein